jgi:uncharacterized protein
LYIRISDIPWGGLDVFAVRGRGEIERLLERVDPYPLRTCRLVSGDLVLRLEKGDVFASGSYVAEGTAQCDRCADLFTFRMEQDFHSVLVPRDREAPVAGVVELHEEDLEIGFYDGTGVEVADIFWDQVVMALPVKLLCREECRGICPRCGVNRNTEACGCPDVAAPGLFEELKTMLDKKE